MRLLIAGNGFTTKIKNSYFKDKNTSNFLKNICDKGSSIFWVEPVFEAKDFKSDLHDKKLPVNEFHLVCDKQIVERTIAYKILFLIRLIFSLIHVINKVDLVYLFLPGKIPVVSGLVALFFGKKISIYLRADYKETSILYKILFIKANFILATGSFFQKKLLKYNSNVHVVATMLDVTENDVFLRDVKNKIQFNILFVGRVHAAKGIWPLIDAVKILVERNYNFTLHIVGGGSEINKLLSYIKEEDLINYVVIHGLISDKSDLRKLYKQSDIFILPSFIEGVPRVIYEALTYSLPIVTTFVGSIPSIMKDQYNCIKIPTNDSLAIVSAFESLFNNYELRKKLSINSYHTIKSYFAERSKYSHAEQLNRLARGQSI